MIIYEQNIMACIALHQIEDLFRSVLKQKTVEAWQMPKEEFIRRTTLTRTPEGKDIVRVTAKNAAGIPLTYKRFNTKGFAYKNSGDTDLKEMLHKNEVEYAFRSGESVPKEILGEYPNMGKE